MPWELLAAMCPVVPRGAPRTNHTLGSPHWAGYTQVVEPEGRGEFVAGARCRYGFGKTWR
jgi:hypothetical protein